MGPWERANSAPAREAPLSGGVSAAVYLVCSRWPTASTVTFRGAGGPCAMREVRDLAREEEKHVDERFAVFFCPSRTLLRLQQPVDLPSPSG